MADYLSRRALLRGVGVSAVAIGLVPLRMVRATSDPAQHAISDASIGDPGPWRFYQAPRGVTFVREYAPLSLRTVSEDVVGVSAGNTPTPTTPPYILWSVGNVAGDVTIRPEWTGDILAEWTGDILAEWTAPRTGNWEVTIHADNVGTDVRGGDGGTLRVTYLPESVAYDNEVTADLRVPASSAEVTTAEVTTVLSLAAGERLLLRADGGIDGFGDSWVASLTISPSAKPAITPVHRGLEGYLPALPSVPSVPGSALRRGTFLLGTDGGWATSTYAEESIRLVRRYVPELAVVLVSGRPDRLAPPALYRELSIPTMIQSHGSGYEPYWTETGAFEVNWRGVDLGISSPQFPLSGEAHAVAHPHPATRHAFEQLIRSALQHGYSSYGFQDFVWMWGGGRGAAGHNPATVEAFRRDLRGLDEGIAVSLRGAASEQIYFSDYARYYLGGMPVPEEFGISDWEDWSPLTGADYDAEVKPDFTADFLLFDLLVSYEWLKLAQFLGQTAQAEGGLAQIMPNPEDMANGADFLFLAGLDAVRYSSEEFFNNPSFLDGAYFHFPSLTRFTRANRSIGVVVESGHGGNAVPYYDPQIAYTLAYELTAATRPTI